jgi:ABC-type xylose transport system permease subunit
MPFALLIVGIVLLVASVRNTQADLYKLVKGDFSGPNNYLYWVVSILIIGAVGYIETLRPISRMFLALVIIVLFLSHGGVFESFNRQLFGIGDLANPQNLDVSGIHNVQLPQGWIPSNTTTSGASSDGLTLQQWLNSLTPSTNFGNESPLAPVRPQ